MGAKRTKLNGTELSPEGEQALRSLLRYVCQHGNVTREATWVARTMRQILGDTKPIDHTSQGGYIEATRLRAAWKAIDTKHL